MSDINPYQAPKAPLADGGMPPAQYAAVGMWRKGSTLVIDKRYPLPPRCIFSGQPAVDYVEVTLSWHPPWWSVFILLGALPYVLIAAAISEKAQLRLGLSREWAEFRTSLMIWFGVISGCCALGLAGGIAAAAGIEEPLGPSLGVPLIILSVLTFLGTSIYAVVRMQTVHPVEIDEHYAHVSGVSEEFLRDLPIWPYA